MRLTTSIIALLLQCVSVPSFAAKGHTINNGGNLAEIRFTTVWNEFDRAMAPCLTPQNICRLSPDQRSLLRSALANKPHLPQIMPSSALLTRADGQPKSAPEMHKVALSILQDCGSTLSTASMDQIVDQALRVTSFARVELSPGQFWYVFARQALLVEDVAAVHDFTPQFRSFLKLPAGDPIGFSQISAKNNDGLIEINGRVSYSRGTARNNSFTLLLIPSLSGKIQEAADLVIFR